MRRKDWRYVYRARRAGAKHAIRIVEEARKVDLPLSWAFALVEQECDFRHVFGHDQGSILHGQKVTKARVARLLRHVDNGGVSNGVGLTQLTWPPFIKTANREGGAHKPRINIRVGLGIFCNLTRNGYGNAWEYNGHRRYQAQIEAKQNRWHRVLVGK